MDLPPFMRRCKLTTHLRTPRPARSVSSALPRPQACARRLLGTLSAGQRRQRGWGARHHCCCTGAVGAALQRSQLLSINH